MYENSMFDYSIVCLVMFVSIHVVSNDKVVLYHSVRKLKQRLGLHSFTDSLILLCIVGALKFCVIPVVWWEQALNWNRTGLAEVLLTVLFLKFTKSGLLNVSDLPEQQG